MNASTEKTPAETFGEYVFGEYVFGDRITARHIYGARLL